MLGLTSVTFRKKTCDEIIALAVENGLSCIEWGGDIHVPCNSLVHAREVGNKTRDAGLVPLSYGSYFRPGTGENFESVIETALALSTKTIRIWTPSVDAECITEDAFSQIVEELKGISDIAAKAGLVVATEFHNGTYSDSAEHCKKLLDAVGRTNFKTYWQPLYDVERNLSDIKNLLGYIENVHVYNWVYGKIVTRKLLSENESDWVQYATLLKDKNLLLEFVKDDSDENFKRDVISLNNILRDIEND